MCIVQSSWFVSSRDNLGHRVCDPTKSGIPQDSAGFANDDVTLTEA